MKKGFAFLSLVVFLSCECLDPKTFNNSKTIQIVTLTRVPMDENGDPRTEDRDYSPITVAEAATVFEITNFLLKGEESEAISNAAKFDEEIFKNLKEIDDKLTSEPSFRLSVAENALKREKCLDGKANIQRAILNLVKEEKEFSITKVVQIKLKGSCTKEINLLSLPKRTKTYKSIVSLRPLMKSSDYDSIKNSSLDEGDGSITFEYKLNATLLEGRDIAAKVEDICKKFSKSRLNDTLRAFLYEEDPILNSYAGISKKDLNYYVGLYKGISSFLSADVISQSSPCLLVVNEQFFGKNFLFPSDFPLLGIMPKFPNNVIVCVNLLKEETQPVEGASVIPANALISSTMDGVGSKQAKDFFTNYSNTFKYENYSTNVDAKNRFFRNVSFFLLDEKKIQEYTKGSYCKEYDALIEGSFAYLFGCGKDLSVDKWGDLLSTQICFDLSSGVREQQFEIKAPVHIIQSNRLDVNQYLINDPQKLVEKSHVPGTPKIIIHSDPSWPEVFVSDGSFTKTIDFSCSHIDTRMHYKKIDSRKTFRFFIDAGNDCKNAYTITYWVINES